MAGLCAAARARELGVTPTLLEKGNRPGGSMLLSSGVVWRYRSLDDFRRECPTGDPRLQRLIVEQLDDALDWLESLGATLVSAETENPRTVGRRFDPGGLTDVLVRAAGDVRIGQALGSDPGTRLEGPLVLATGGFPVRLAQERGLAVRSNPWSEGDGLELGVAAGAATTPGMDEFYGRAMPAPPASWGEREFVDHAQLYGHLARVFDESGEEIAVADEDWSENGLVQKIARLGGRVWFVVDPHSLERK
jgi:fumarate reductase flavoprotein subunit